MPNKEVPFRNRIGHVILFLGILFFLLLSGCSTTKYIPLKDNLASLEPLNLVYSKNIFYVHHAKGNESSTKLLLGPVLGPAVGAGITSWEKLLKDEIENSDLPKFGDLVIKKLAERMSNEIQDWPGTITKDKLLISWRQYKKDYFNSKSGSIMFFFFATSLRTDRPIGFGVTIYMYSANDEYCYIKDFGQLAERQYSIEEYKADNFKILREIIEAGAENLTEQIIQDIKKEIREE